MSRRIYKQFAGQAMIADPVLGITYDFGTTVPADGALGYAPGCIFQDLDAAAGANLFVNQGTKASASFRSLAFGGLNRNETNTAITTIGAGTLTGAALVGGVITRSGSTADYTDTTDTAALIIAALPAGTAVGTSWEVLIKNTVPFTETLAAGAGVTLSGQTVVPPNSTLRVLLTYATATTVTMQGLNVSNTVSLMPAKFTTTAAASPLTAAAGDLTGANHVVFQVTTNGAFALTTRTATQMFGDIPNCAIGFAYLLTIVSQGDNTVTVTAGSGVTITGTATVATKTTRTFVATFTSATALTLQSVSKGTIE